MTPTEQMILIIRKFVFTGVSGDNVVLVEPVELVVDFVVVVECSWQLTHLEQRY